MSDAEEIKPEVSASEKNVVLPPYWVKNGRLWFIQAEAIFETANIKKEASKLNHLIKMLPFEIIEMVEDLVSQPNIGYEVLKKSIIDRTEDSEKKRMKHLLSASDMGDMTPSRFYRYLGKLAGTSTAINSDFITKLWLSRLPSHVSSLLSVFEDKDINELQVIADKVFECTPDAVSEVHVKSNEEIIDLKKLNVQVAELQSKFDRFAKNSQRSRSSSRSSSRNRSSGSKQFCWYHFRFGIKAKKCNRPDCSFNKKNQKN